jgi:hypothetical protein
MTSYHIISGILVCFWRCFTWSQWQSSFCTIVGTHTHTSSSFTPRLIHPFQIANIPVPNCSPCFFDTVSVSIFKFRDISLQLFVTPAFALAPPSCPTQAFGVPGLLAAAEPAAGKHPSLINSRLVIITHTWFQSPLYHCIYTPSVISLCRSL